MSPDQKARMEARRVALLAYMKTTRDELREIDAALAADRVQVWARKNDQRAAAKNPPHWLSAIEDRHERDQGEAVA